MAEDDIDLASLPDDELVQQMHDDLYDGLLEEIQQGVNILLERGWTPYDVLTKALVEGMRIVGEDFRDGILFVPEVLLSANAMKAGMFILRPLLVATGAPKQGKMVIGTVKGDIHDIGKNLVGMMMEGAGFEVVDLGINNPVENYLEALEENRRYSGGRKHRNYLLTGLVTCETCGGACTGRTHITRGKKYAYYRCADSHPARAYRGPIHEAPYVPAEWLEEIVWADVRQFLENPGETLARVREQMGSDDDSTELEERRTDLTKRLACKHNERDRWLHLYAQGHISDMGWRRTSLTCGLKRTI